MNWLDQRARRRAMLSAFTARPLVELKQRDKSKIESVLAYGDRLLVGLNNGNLRIYRVNEVCNGRQAEDDHLGEGEEGGSTLNNGDSSRPATMSSVTNPKPKQSELLPAHLAVRRIRINSRLTNLRIPRAAYEDQRCDYLCCDFKHSSRPRDWRPVDRIAPCRCC